MERLLFIHFDERALPRAKGGAGIDIAEQDIARAVIEGVGDDQLVPAIERHIEGVGVLPLDRLAPIDQLFGIDAEVAQQAIGDVSVAQLILNDGDGRAEGVDVGGERAA